MEKISRTPALRTEIAKTQVVVIAGGRGLRLGIDAPKCLLEISGKTLIEICIGTLAQQGFGKFVFLLGYGHERVERHLGISQRHGITARFSIDPPVESGWGKGKAFKSALANGRIDRQMRSLVVFPDDLILDNSAHKEFLFTHIQCVQEFGSLASVLLANGVDLPYGTAKTDPEGMVLEFVEKPQLPYQVSVGIYAFEPCVYDMIDAIINLADPAPVDLESSILPKLVASRGLSSMSIPPDKWLPINTLKDYEKALKVFGSIT